MLGTPMVNGRPAGDVLSRVVRITLAGRAFALPVRSIKFNREWKAQLDLRTAGILAALDDAGDDWEKVLAQLSQNAEPFIDLLVSYAPSVLSRELIEDLEPDPTMDVITACREVWLAANPLVAIGIAGLTEAVSDLAAKDGSQPTSSPPLSTAGPPTSSNGGSPTSSSSPTSTQPSTDSSAGEKTTSTPRSSLSGRARSTPTTPKRSRAGSGTPTRRPAGHNGASPARRSRPQ